MPIRRLCKRSPSKSLIATQKQNYLKDIFLLSSKLASEPFIYKALWAGEITEAQATGTFSDKEKGFIVVFPVVPYQLDVDGAFYFNIEAAKHEKLSVFLRESSLKTATTNRFSVDFLASGILALRQMHASGITVQSLDPSKVIVTSTGEPKIYDLNKAYYFQPGNINISKTDVTVYSAPEVLSSRTCSYASDVYSLEAFFYIFLTDEEHRILPSGRYATFLKKPSRLKFKRGFKDLYMRMNIPFGMPDLIKKMLEPHPTQRITLEDAMSHEVFEDFEWIKLSVK